MIAFSGTKKMLFLEYIISISLTLRNLRTAGTSTLVTVTVTLSVTREDAPAVDLS